MSVPLPEFALPAALPLNLKVLNCTGNARWRRRPAVLVASCTDGALFRDGDGGRHFQVIALTPLSCRELIFSTCSHESYFFQLCLTDLSACVRVCLLAVCPRALTLVLDKSGETRTWSLQRGGCSNYVQLGSLSHPNPPTALLPPHISHMHKDNMTFD